MWAKLYLNRCSSSVWDLLWFDDGQFTCSSHEIHRYLLGSSYLHSRNWFSWPVQHCVGNVVCRDLEHWDLWSEKVFRAETDCPVHLKTWGRERTKYGPWTENFLSHSVRLKTNDRGLLCSYFGVLNGMSSTVIAASTQLLLPSRHPSQPHPCPPCPSAEIGWTWRCGSWEGIKSGNSK